MCLTFVQCLEDAFNYDPSMGPFKKMCLFSYHDITISALLSVLIENFEWTHRPGYMSALFFELYVSDTNPNDAVVRTRVTMVSHLWSF